MKTFCSILILCLALGTAVQAKPSAVQTQLQVALNRFQGQSRDFDATATGDLTSQCFGIYLPMLNEVADTFSSDYQACITTANQDISNLTTQADKNQALYKQEVSDICSTFATCDSNNDTVSFFNCYAAAAQTDVSTIYDISTSAASAANTLGEGIKGILDTEYQCTNTTESNYVRDTAATYDLLDNCLKNGVPAGSTVAPTGSSTSVEPFSTFSTDAASDVTSTDVSDESSSVVTEASTAAPAI